MRVVIQRVANASIEINSQIFSSIQNGLLIFLGIEEADDSEDIDYLSSKILSLRIFSDEQGRMNLNIEQVNGELLIVSQFTLHAQTKKGNRPSFIKAAHPNQAKPLYENFVSKIFKLQGKEPKTGVFGADMKIHSVNDGPVTIWMDSKNKE